MDRIKKVDYNIEWTVGLSDWPEHVHSYRLFFKVCSIKVAALMLPVPLLLGRKKQTLLETAAIPHAIKDHKLFRKVHTSRCIIINTGCEALTGKTRVNGKG